ncbi:MAG: tetratricopeptide repeat protein [Candidatus Contendobacter sp.]|nr:tetratricopeptide repeat protein [Candidatus Contendobacter sp.]MDG4556363.1 tetratricopeptide repeat protein [Candidatus Contendobacter sp.]
MSSKRQRRTKKNDSILDQIERAIRWGDEFRLVFVKCNHSAQREILQRTLLDRLQDQRVLEISLEKPIISLLDEIRPLWNLDQPPAAVCVYGLENSLREQGQNSPVLGQLNHERDLLRQFIPAALLIWLPDFALDYIARGAPDFWAWRSGVYEFQTDSALWQMESIAAFGNHDTVSLGSLSWEEKQKEIIRLEELLRTSQALTRQDTQVKQTNRRFLSRLGFLYYSLGKQDEALDRYQESLKLAQAIGDRAGEGRILSNLSVIHHAHGDNDTALRYLEESLLVIQRAIGDRAGEGRSLNNLSQFYHARGDDDTARRYLEEALAIQRAIGDRAGESATLNNLSAIYHARGDDDTARRYLEEALAIQRAIGDRAGLCQTLFNMGHFYRQKDEYQQARACWVEAYRIAKEIGYADALTYLEKLAKQLGGDGLEYWEQLAQSTPDTQPPTKRRRAS